MNAYRRTSKQILILAGAVVGLIVSGLNGAANSQPASKAEAISKALLFKQPIVWVGESQPSAEDTDALSDAIKAFEIQGVEAGLAALEQFLVDRPNSPWAPSLRGSLGDYYRTHGRYTLALQHWEAAWNSSKSYASGNGKKVADYTLAHLTRLLASLGRSDKLKTIFDESNGRVLDAGPLQQMFNGTKEGYQTMQNNPGVSYRCGTFALSHVGMKLNPTNMTLKELLLIHSPATGFSMADLTGFAAKFEINVKAVRRPEGSRLVTPSVVHWRQNHYAAIVEKRGNRYNVIDPTFGRSQWLSEETINAEASGNFLVPADQIPESWQVLTADAARTVFGKGAPNNIDDEQEEDCPTDEDESTECPTCQPGSGSPGSGGPGSGGPGSGGPGSGGPGSGGCCGGGKGPVAMAGMPAWRVSEPFITLWLDDIPYFYQTSLGRPFSFKLSYKQRNTRATDNMFGVGKLWECSWLSFVTTDSGNPYQAIHSVMGGGERAYAPDGVTREYKSTSTLTNFITGGGAELYQVDYPSGAKSIYGYQFGYSIGITNRFLTEKVDARGRSTKFYYETTNDIVRLLSVVDVDGRTNRVYYTNTLAPELITSVKSPYNQEAFLQYDADGRLTNIIDAVDLPSGMVYDPTDSCITNLVTRYGVTTFQTTSNGFSGWDLGGDDVVNRSILVTEPDGGKHLYFYRDESHQVSPGAETSLQFEDQGFYWQYLTSEIPVTDPLSCTFENFYWNHARNSYYWGPRQLAALSSGFRDSIEGAYDLTAFYNLTLDDYRLARIRHWLHREDDYYRVGQTLSVERFPSPNGVGFGQKVFYDYANNLGLLEGDFSLPQCIAKVLPDGTSSFTYMDRNERGHVTNTITTYTLTDGSVGLRTNLTIYDANGIDRLFEIGPDGATHASYFYDNEHQVLRFTNAMDEVTYYTYDADGRVTSIETPAGLLTTNIYYSSGDSKGFLEKTIDIQIGRTNSYTYTNGLVYTHTDERGLATTNLWDKLERLRRISYPDGTFITNHYERLDLVRRVDRMNFTNSFGYDSMRRMVAQTNALGRYTLYSYCSCGSLDAAQDAGGNTTSYYYDNIGQLLRVVYPDLFSVTNHYNLIGQVTNTVDSFGTSVTNWFNHQGLLVTASNAFGQMFKRTYDIEDRLTNTVDAAGVSIDSTYDHLGRLLTRSYPDNGVERFGYSARGLLAYTNQLNLTNFYVYDAAQRKIFETNANAEVIQFKYDVSGNLTNLVDARSQNTFWKYDEYSRVTNKIDHLGTNLFAYKYDPNSRLTNRWSAAKGDTKYKYDAVGNLTDVDYAVSSDITLKYDALNRLTNMVDAVGTTKYGYSTAGQLLSEDGPWSDDTVSYTYQNRLRQTASVVAPNATVWTVNYGYDAMKRLNSLTSPAGGFGYEYSDVNGDISPATLVKTLALPTGGAITNLYDSNARLLATILTKADGAKLNAHEYIYNPGNQRTNQTRVSLVSTNGPAYLATNSVGYGYDNIGQLLAAAGKEADNTTLRLSEQFAYTYDKAGNLSNRVQNVFTNTFNVNSLNQLTTVARAGNLTVAGTTTGRATNVTVNTLDALLYNDATFARTNLSLSDGNNTFTAIAKDSYGRLDTNATTVYLPATLTCVYDLNGNLRTNGNRVMEYDDENQLTAVTVSNAWRSEFKYDGKMRRRIRKEYTWQSSSWLKTNEVHYVYDGNLVIQERDDSNLPLVTYTRGKDLSGSLEGAGGIGGLLVRTANSRLLSANSSDSHAFYHADGNGNVTCLINTNELMVAKYLYDPYGNTLSASGPLAEANLYRFSSKELHANSDLVSYLYRYYQANLQRWLNRDPIGERGGRNLHKFVRNNPLLFVDPRGLTIRFDPNFPEIPHWHDCICKLMTSPAGRELVRRAAQPNIDIVIQTGTTGTGGTKEAPIIYIDPTDPIGVDPEKRWIRELQGELPPNTLAGCAVVLAHELGHAIDPKNEDEPDGTNVHDNENPVRLDLDVPARKTRDGYPVRP